MMDAGRIQETAERSHTLPASWYTDPSVFEREKEAIFYRGWWYAGTLEDVAEPGSYLTTTVADQDIAVLRGRDCVLRAFHNVCSHRAHRLLDGKGRRTAIVCPYHNWSYETDDAFKTGRGIDGMCDFDRASAALKPDARPLDEVTDGMLADMRAHCPGLDRLTLAHHIEVPTAANWKTLVNNDLESYRVAASHPDPVDLLDYETFEVWEYELTTCHAMTNTNPDNRAYHVGGNDPVQRAIYTWLWPNTAFFIAPGRNNLAIFHMIPTGAETSVQSWDFYFEDPTPTKAEQEALDYTCDILIPGDTAIYGNVQRGLRSRGYEQGRLVINRDWPELSEHHVHMFQELVRDALLGAV